MSKEKRRVPKLRFPGFTEDWEQRKLNDFVTIRRGLTYKPSDIAENGIRVLRSSNIDEDQFIKSNDDVFVNIDAVNIPFAKNGDILITSANGSSRLVGKHTIINDIAENSAVHGGFMLLAESNNPLFTDALLSSNWYKRFINTYVAGGNGAIGNLSKSDLESQSVMVPSEHEQIKIGQWYGSINQLITLHQRKLEHLILKKKSLLQKLFPKNGERYPELRFPGFTDAWEQRKLSDVADVRDGTHDSPKFYNDGFPLVTSKNLKDGSIDFSDCSFISEQDFNEINKRSKVDPGDILFGMIGTIGNPAIVEHTGFAIKNVALIKEGNIINNRFIYHLLSSKVFENYIARENAGGTQKFIALNQIRNFDFLAPTLVEQSKIIELLDCISQNITLHQRKLEHLQLQKKALLQQMFV